MSDSPPKLRVGVMGCSSFALRAMIPAIASCPEVELVAVASREGAKAREVSEKFSCRGWGSYAELVADADVDLIYMPLPTGLHEEWVHRALDAGKHLLVEKSLSDTAASAGRIVEHARKAGRLLLENFLFLRHRQYAWVKGQLAEGALGEFKFFRAAFTIPPLDDRNFRYDASLGGGALLDAGAYMVKSVLAFLGPEVELLAATSEFSPARGVDIRGTAVFRNPAGVVAQVLWGFDSHYQCSWDLQGTAGRIVCDRALTPPPGFEPTVRQERGQEKQELKLPADNHYVNQWGYVGEAVRHPESIPTLLDEAFIQAQTLDLVRQMAK